MNDDYIQTTELVLESELNCTLRGAKDDFKKLLVSNARQRIFICFKEPHELAFLEYCRKAVEYCDSLHKDDRVLVLLGMIKKKAILHPIFL